MPEMASRKPTAMVPTKAAGTAMTRPTADLRGPKANGDHGEDMVRACQRVGDAGHEGAMLGRIEVGKGRSCGSGENAGGERKAFKHHCPSFWSTRRPEISRAFVRVYTAWRTLA